MMTTSPRLFIMMFCGLRSRWITPRSWAAARPAHSLRAVSSALSAGSRPMRVQQRRQVLAVHVFHGDERHALDLADVVNAADVGMRDLARHAHLAVEAFEQPLVLGGLLGQEFQRHRLAERQVGGAIDLAHAAAAQQSDDAVAPAQQRSRDEAAFVGAGRRRRGDVRYGSAGHSRRGTLHSHGLGNRRVGRAVHLLRFYSAPRRPCRRAPQEGQGQQAAAAP